ncbi:MAG: hypothetical protein GYB66_07945 [Chloroflexi bacterium]|nr:hypothetical protein [Chloroflexota bacterium]
MGDVLSLIESLAPGLYVICGLLLVWNIRSLIIAEGELRYAQYGLEKELAERRGGRSLTMVVIMIEILVVVWGVSNVASPAWSEGLPDGTAEAGQRQFMTSTPGSGGDFEFQIASPQPTDVLATAAPPSTPIGTIGPHDPKLKCDTSRAWIDYPANGMYIFEDIDVIGTASIENFAKYRFEIKGPSSSEFSVYTQGDRVEPVVDGPLGRISPLDLIPGQYRFRLVVFDTDNNPRAQCEITIWIQDPVPTATPIGAGSIE